MSDSCVYIQECFRYYSIRFFNFIFRLTQIQWMMFEWCRGHVWNVCFRIVPLFKNNVIEYIWDLTESAWLWSQRKNTDLNCFCWFVAQSENLLPSAYFVAFFAEALELPSNRVRKTSILYNSRILVNPLCTKSFESWKSLFALIRCRWSFRNNLERLCCKVDIKFKMKSYRRFDKLITS